jgi:hypothetical protein
LFIGVGWNRVVDAYAIFCLASAKGAAIEPGERRTPNLDSINNRRLPVLIYEMRLRVAELEFNLENAAGPSRKEG